jgi:hypothetical protein
MRKRLLAALFFCLGALLLGGCFTMSDEESEIPWSRQKDWEQQVPGMGGGGF